MQFKRLITVLPLIFSLMVFVQFSTAQTITSNRTGVQGEFHYEYWKDNGSGTMILGEGGDFSCSWDAHNILFRKGIRPGERNQTVTYSADFKPNGNSYLSVYGWTKNPLVEYYIIESWGTWKPPGGRSKGTVESDGGTYDIYETTRNNQPSIEGTKTFQQYWSVRKEKKESGIITCKNHFDAWEKAGMKMGSLYEVSFNVEGWESRGEADVTMSMDTGSGNTTEISSMKLGEGSLQENIVNAQGTSNVGYLNITKTGTQTITFTLPVNSYVSVKVYNYLGQEITRLGEKEYGAGKHSVSFNAQNLAHGVYYYALKVR
jgi:endo-1,4-beta-xylanase